MDIDQIWNNYRSALKRFLHSRISNPDDVDDLLQDVLIKIHKNLHTIQEESKIKSWLFQIANHTIIDFYRKEGRIDKVNPADLLLTENESPDASHVMSECVRPFINALPQNSSALLTSIDIEGQSQKEVAKELGISYSTLKSRVQKSRRELRGLFEECCQISFDQRNHVIDFEPKSTP